jgi:anti-sigma factor RsiW
MQDKHWTDDELVSTLFDVGPTGGHLERCPDCARRYQSIKQKHAGIQQASAPVTESRLAAQRRAVRAQLEKRDRTLFPILAPSLAAVVLLILGVFIAFRPDATKPAEQVPAIVEDREIEEIFQLSSNSEPAAIEPVQSLFEEVE